jgi:hypothetical protein
MPSGCVESEHPSYSIQLVGSSAGQSFAKDVEGRDIQADFVAVGSASWSRAALAASPTVDARKPAAAVRMGEADAVIQQAIHDQQIPGAVLVVGMTGR